MRLSRIPRRTLAPATLAPAALAAALAVGGLAAVAPSSAADASTCLGRVPTIIATTPGETVIGTDGDDVILAWGVTGVSVYAGAGNDRVCGDPAVVAGGDGNDAIVTVGGAVSGGPGDDVIVHAGGSTDGGPGNDRLVQREGGRARGGDGDDAVTARVHAGPVDPALPPWETAVPAGGRVFELAGGEGRDTVFVRGSGARIDLAKGRVRFAGTTARLRSFEDVVGTAGPDLIVGDARRNTLSGKGGRDRIYGGPGGDLLQGGAGRDLLVGQGGLDGAHGGRGVDRCLAELAQNC